MTKLRADMKLEPPYRSAVEMECAQGQRLEWWEYEPESEQQWFRVAEPSESVLALLGSRRLSPPFQLPCWTTRNALWIIAAGQRCRQTVVATSPALDRTDSVI